MVADGGRCGDDGGFDLAGTKKLVEMPVLRELRKRLGFTQRELRERTGVGMSTINALENGKRGVHESTAEKLARGLGVPVEVLTGEKGFPIETAGFRLEANPVGGALPAPNRIGGRSTGAGVGFVAARELADQAARAEARLQAEAEGRTILEVLLEYESEYRRGIGSVLSWSAASLETALARAEGSPYAPVGIPFIEKERLAGASPVSAALEGDKRHRDY